MSPEKDQEAGQNCGHTKCQGEPWTAPDGSRVETAVCHRCRLEEQEIKLKTSEAACAAKDSQIAALVEAAVESQSDGWTDCMLCGATWRAGDGEQEYHMETCPVPLLSPSAGEGCEHEFTGGKGAYPGQWSRCLKCKQIVLRPGGEGWVPPVRPERLAQIFHEAYERLAPEFGYKTREASAVPWEEVPDGNKRLMIATARAALDALKEK